jgi:glycerol-3-phosphate dehydrogenase (NAD(P)+)
MAKVAAMRGHDVRLWGTWLDDPMLEPLERGEVHPRLGLTLEGIATHRSPRLAEALEGAEMIIHGVNSDGAVAVMKRAAAHLPDVPVLSVTKGFLETSRGVMEPIDAALSETAGRKLRWVHASGPAKAIEVSRRVLTLMVFAGADAAFCAEAIGGDHLRVGVTDDLLGAEIASALKNAYATGLGIWDGLLGKDAHDARAACFTQAVAEMRKVVLAAGGREATVYGAAGMGDLHVTAAAGRNRAFGERVGRGKPAKQVAEEMLASGELTEGYPAIASAWRFAREHGITDLPLLEALHAVVWGGEPVRDVFAALRIWT